MFYNERYIGFIYIDSFSILLQLGTATRARTLVYSTVLRAFASRGATSKSFAAGGAHALLCLLNFLGSSRTLGVVSRLA